MKAERRLQGAKQQTKELLDLNINDWEGRKLEDHRKQIEFDKGRMKLMKLIVLAEEVTFAEDDAPTEEAAPVEGAASEDEEERRLPEPAEDLAPPDETLRTAAVQDETGRNNVSDYDPELKHGVDSEVPQETRVPDPFEDSWDSTGAGELDKIATQVDQEIADLGSHIDLRGVAVSKQEHVDGRVGNGGKGGMTDQLVKKEVW